MNKLHRLCAEYRSLGTLLHANEVVLVLVRDSLTINTRGDWCKDTSQSRSHLGVAAQVGDNERDVCA